MKDNRPVIAALKKYIEQGNCTEAEIALLEVWAEESEYNRQLWDKVKEGDFPREVLKELEVQEASLNGLMQRFWRDYADPAGTHTLQPALKRVPFFRRAGWRYAAIFILIVGAATYFWLFRPGGMQRVTQRTGTLDIAPGRDGAVLTLADGRTIVLDSLSAGTVAAQNGVRLVLDNNRLAYLPEGGEAEETTYNILSTPKGRQFKIILSDGTAVWLNASSSLRYPAVFGRNGRTVEITGEAYFEVKEDARNPFIVKAGDGAAVEVLGTRFNVNAYPDESVKNITLLDGSVRAIAETEKEQKARKELILKPGQQAVIRVARTLPVLTTDAAGRQEQFRSTAVSGKKPVADDQPALMLIDHPDIEKVMAWKNGIFNFDNAGLEEVMRQLSRWYDIEVVYEKGIPDIHFFGKMSRNINLSDLLRILEDSNIHFRIEAGRKLVVRP